MTNNNNKKAKKLYTLEQINLFKEKRKLKRAKQAMKRQKKIVVVDKFSTTKFRRGRAAKTQNGTLQKASMEFTLNHLLDTSHLLQTLFYPNLGVFRGLCKGSASTSLCTIKTSFDLPCTANATLGLSWVPTDLTGAGSVTYYNNAAGVVDPYHAGFSASPGPFSTTNPSTDYRVVSAHMILIPSASLLNNNGEGQLGYFPSFPGAVAGSTSYQRANVDELFWTKPVSAPKSYILNWVPNQYEVDFTKSGVAYPDPSSFLFYFANGANQMSWRCEIQTTIEYLPTVAYRPFVMREPPLTPLSAYDELNRHLITCWDTCVLADYDAWRAASAIRESKGGHTVVEKMMNAGSGPLSYMQIVGRGAAEVLSGASKIVDSNGNYIPDFIEVPLQYVANKAMGY